MKIMRTYVFKLYRSKRTRHLDKSLDVAADIWNHCIALHRRYYRLFGKHLSVNNLKVHITKLKKQEKFAEWNALGSQAIQDIPERIERSYKTFFEWIKKHKGERKLPPHFKKRSKYRSFTLKQAGYSFEDGNILVIMKRRYKYFANRPIEGKIKTLTIKRDALGEFYAYAVCEVEVNEVLPRTGKAVGLDFGLKNFLTKSDGKMFSSPLFFYKGSKRIEKLSRALSKKQKNSYNRRRAKRVLALEHERIARRRKDYHRKLAQRIAAEYAIICIEDLNLKAMQRLWGKKISDLGFSSFLLILEQECQKAGSTLIKVDRFYPSSQLCSECGHQNPETKNLKIREWVCPHCGKVHQRDVNAAINIKREGLRLYKLQKAA